MFDKAVFDPSVYSKMQVDEPYKRYKKVILGKVFVFYLDPFSGKMEGKILAGDPNKGDEGCYLETWTDRDDIFFRRMNEKHFKAGRIIEAVKEAKPVVVKNPNEMTDDELEGLASSRYMKLVNTLNKMTSTAVVSRLLNIAMDLEKSEKILTPIKARLSELERLELEGPQEDN